MRALAEAYPDEGFVQQAVARIPWGHNVRGSPAKWQTQRNFAPAKWPASIGLGGRLPPELVADITGMRDPEDDQRWGAAILSPEDTGLPFQVIIWLAMWMPTDAVAHVTVSRGRAIEDAELRR